MTDTPRQGRRQAAKPTAQAAAIEVPEEESKGITAGKGRATPGRRQTQPETEERRGFFGGLVDYVQGVRAEIDKVAWPTREQVIALFQVVVIVTIAAAAALGLIAFFFNELFAIGLNNPVIFVVFGAAVAGIVLFVMRRNAEAGPSR